MFEFKNVSFQYHQENLIQDLSLTFPQNQITSIIGPNGSGKSTLLMLMARLLKPHQGTIFYDGKNIHQYKLKEFAQKVAVVHQKNHVDHDLDVETIVGYGRLPYLHHYQNMTSQDKEIVEWALHVTQLQDLRSHTLKKLSGGQQQRVWLAMALAQKTPLLLLDEPTTYLDVKYQIEILRLIRHIHQQWNMSIIMVHHDINQAIHYSDHIVAMKNGRIVRSGAPQDIICEDCLKELYDFDIRMIEKDHQKIVLNY